MEESVFIEKLVLFGLSRQEATIYVCLLKNSELTGYEVAKLTGISRSNVYNALAALVEHGAAYVVEGASTKYIAVDIEEFCDNRIRYLKEVEKYLLLNRPKQTSVSEGYITIEGHRHICDKIHHMLVDAKLRIYFSAHHSFLEKWQEELVQLVQREIKVVLISDDLPKVFTENDELRKRIIFYQTAYDLTKECTEEQWERHVRLIIDSEYVLTGELVGGGNDTCLYSGQRNFVNVFKDAMRNEIELIKIKSKTED